MDRASDFGSDGCGFESCLGRYHLLALAMQAAPGEKYGAGRFALVYHPIDVECVQALQKYRSYLKPDDHSFIAIPLNELVRSWQPLVNSPAEKDWLDRFTLRYLDLQASEADFNAYKAGQQAQRSRSSDS